MNANCKPFTCHLTWHILLALLLCQQINGQNLVPNPSFEDINTCAEFSQPCSPSAWFYLSRKLTTGYFPRFPSATGHRHLQIVAASREMVNRQYWETMLLCPLKAGERYTVSMKVAAPGNKEAELSVKCPNLRDIGLWFTSRFVFVQGDSLLQPSGYLSFAGASAKDLKNGWFEVKKEFTAGRATSILVVGNFVRVANLDIMDQRSWTGPTIDVLVDDISVVPVNGSICPGYQKVKDSLYAITRRHSDNVPGESDLVDDVDSFPNVRSGGVPPPGGRAPGGQNPDRSTDSLQRPKSNPIDDPLFGPEPRRVVDTPKTDTLIVHNIQFDFDKYLVQNPDTLQRYRSLLTRPGVKKIQVVGFTDDVGSEAYNQDLSEKRAREVARLLSVKFGIAPGLISAEGRGISRSYPTKDLNRRVEIYIFHE
jgi:outer membrane protein OmpA-like peptidoglycan-associated protein